MKRLIILAALLAIAGCDAKPAQESQRVGEFQVDTLFTKDGCTVYRFVDVRTRYFTNCKGSTDYLEGGKHKYDGGISGGGQ